MFLVGRKLGRRDKTSSNQCIGCGNNLKEAQIGPPTDDIEAKRLRLVGGEVRVFFELTVNVDCTLYY